MDVYIPDPEFRSNCISERAASLGYFWCGPFLYYPDGHKIARYAQKLCSSDGTWASERYDNSRFCPDKFLADDDLLITRGFDLEKVKLRTEEWLVDNPVPPALLE